MKNIILKSITAFAAFIFLFSVCCMDSIPNTPFYVAAFVSLAWLIAFAISNGVFGRGETY